MATSSITQQQKDTFLAGLASQLKAGTMTAQQVQAYTEAINQFPVIQTINPTSVKNTTTSGDTTDAQNATGLTYEGLNGNIYNIPEEVFKTLVPILKPGTTEYQTAMDNISNAYFDVLQQQMDASTEQQKEAAEYNWQTLKKYIETNLNTTLSGDAFQAWDQVQALNSQMAGQNIQGSGIQNESIDNYLAKVRRADAVARTTAATEQEAKQQDYYMKFATPQQIKEFALSNPTLAKSWGLVPSDEIKNAMSYATLKAKYPNLSDEAIQSYIATVLDENGNYRSSLYQKYMTGSNLGADPAKITNTTDQYGNVTSSLVTPSDTGVLDIKAAADQNKKTQAEVQNLNADLANRTKIGSIPTTKYTDVVSSTAGGTTFNQPAKADANTVTGTPTTPATLDDPLGLKAASAAASKLSTASSTTNAPAVTTPSATTTTTKLSTPTATNGLGTKINGTPKSSNDYDAWVAKGRTWDAATSSWYEKK